MLRQKNYSDSETSSDASAKSNNAAKLQREKLKKMRGREKPQLPEELVVQEDVYEELVLVRVSVELHQAMASVAESLRLEAQLELDELGVVSEAG